MRDGTKYRCQRVCKLRVAGLIYLITLFSWLASLQAQTPLPNPDLLRKCPYDIIFVLDESGSIVGQQPGTTYISPQIRNGSSALINSLNGTSSRVAVVEFNSTARRAVIGGSVAYQTIDNAYVAAFNNYINPDNNNTPDAARYDPEDYSLSQYWTNWEDALTQVQIINSTEDTADLVIFFTDGMPTAYIDASGNVVQPAVTQQALLDATGAANVVKTQGSHIFVVGIPNPNLPEANVQVISDTDKYPVPEPDFLKGDYSVSTPATLEQDLAGLVLALITDSTEASFEYEILPWSNNCDSFFVQFTNTSTGASSYYWDFGDSIYSTDTSLIHLFNSGGPFVVMLAAHHSGPCGVNDTLYDTLNFTLHLDTLRTYFNYSYTPDCDSLLVQFNGSPSDSAAFFWDFGNGQTATGSNTSTVYLTPATYYITMTATPTVPCYEGNTAWDTITFNPIFYNSVAAFDTHLIYKNDCDTFVVKFTNLSYGGTSYFWDFGNGITSADTNAIISFASGNYDVTLQVNDSRNCWISDTAIVPLAFSSVVTRPDADFDYAITPSCEVVELSLSNHSSGTEKFVWRINGFIFSTDVSPNSPMIYYKADTLAVELIAEGINNCAVDDTVSEEIILPSPFGFALADFDFKPIRPEVDEVIQFYNLSQRAEPSLYRWDFGDGTESAEVSPKHSYSQEGEYEICLSADNGHNCPSSACKDVPVVLTAYADLPTAFTPNGDDNNDVFKVRWKNVIKMHLRIFNRWGELVFESRDPNIGWDGTYKGEPQEMEVYDWLLNAAFKNGREIFRKGNVTLLR